MGKGRAGRVLPGFVFFYLSCLGLIFLLGILYRLQVMSGTVVVHELPAPLGDSFLTQSQERGPWYSLLSGQDVGNRVSEAAFLSYYQSLLHLLTGLCAQGSPSLSGKNGELSGGESRGQSPRAPGSLQWTATCPMTLLETGSAPRRNGLEKHTKLKVRSFWVLLPTLPFISLVTQGKACVFWSLSSFICPVVV